MNKLYIKKLKIVSDFHVYIVDGSYIRLHIDNEFTNFGQHYRFNFIPPNEFWLDRSRSMEEVELFIHHMLIEHRMMARGSCYYEALAKANAFQKKERKKVFATQWVQKHTHVKKNADGIKQSLIKKYSKYLNIWVVKGRDVRNYFYIDFTQGGHDKIYKFIPPGEIWLDDDLPKTEWKYVLLHELHERNLMIRGYEYDFAHTSASIIEHTCRQHPNMLDVQLIKAIEQNKH